MNFLAKPEQGQRGYLVCVPNPNRAIGTHQGSAQSIGRDAVSSGLLSSVSGARREDFIGVPNTVSEKEHIWSQHLAVVHVSREAP